MRSKISSKFNTSPDKVWELVKRSDTMIFIAKPIVSFQPVGKQFPEIWEEGQYETSVKLFGFIPIGSQVIRISIDSENRRIRDDGFGKKGLLGLMSKWDHYIFIDNDNKNPNITNYTDQIEVKAGLLTIFIWIFANIFYMWRQYRWKKLLEFETKKIK